MPNSETQLPMEFAGPITGPASKPMHFSDIERTGLYARLDRLLDRYHFRDESDLFADLVNTSTVLNSPYHRWARYREGYSPKLVRCLINRAHVDPSTQFVIDPMCGSGTSIVAANEYGIDSLGCDVNQYAVDLTNAKTYHYSGAELEEAAEFAESIPHLSMPYKVELRDSVKKYFQPDKLEALLKIRAGIERIRLPGAKRLAFIAWLAAIEDCSERKKDGNGLATISSRVIDVSSFVAAKLRSLVDDIRNHPLPSNATGIAVSESAVHCEQAISRFAEGVNKKPAAVIFSPPYANSFDYFESYKLELLLGEYCDAEGLVSKRTAAVRNYRICYGFELVSPCDLVELTCAQIMSAVPKKEELMGKRDARTRIVPNLLRGYFEDMHKVLKSIYSSLIAGGYCFIVVDQSSYVGVIVATDLILAYLAEQVGFGVESISKCRRANTSGQQLARFPYLGEYLQESIVTLAKPKWNPYG